MRVELLLIVGGAPQRPPLATLDWDSAPTAGEGIIWGPRQYRCVGRAWRLEGTPPTAMIGVLLDQVGGPPHVVVEGSGLTPGSLIKGLG